MNTAVKIIGLAALAGGGYWLFKKGQAAISNFDFTLVGFGQPTLSSNVVSIPLKIRFVNPTPLPITLDNLKADVYLNKNGVPTLAAKINQPLTVPAGTTDQWIIPQVQLATLFGGNVMQTLAAVAGIVASKMIHVKTVVVATYKGVSLPEQIVENDLPIT